MIILKGGNMKVENALNNIIKLIDIDWGEAKKRKKQVMKKEDIEHYLTHMFVNKSMSNEVQELKFRTFKILKGNILKEGYNVNLKNLLVVSEPLMVDKEKLEVLIAEGYVTKYKNKTESMIAYYNYVINKEKIEKDEGE